MAEPDDIDFEIGGEVDLDLDLDPALAAAIAAAEAAVADLSGDYVAELARDVATLDAAASALAVHAPGTEEHAQALADAFRVSHDIKGQAASFGFADASELCDMLCQMLRERQTASEDAVAVVITAARKLAEMVDAAPQPEV